ncbi:hypothetical protein lerEdw1_000039 [Lerista edwardsae]|nr:hypothetical protein lerEdw1_000039 [Lerista edwardsae]
MRPDDINPRTGFVVALVSVFLVFGFMFTVSGIKGETLGDIPLLAIGPAICLPGIAAIALTRKTDGCTKWPENRARPPCGCCRKKPKEKDGEGGGEDAALAPCPAITAAAGECQSVVQEEMLRYLENCYPEMPGNVFVAEATPYRALPEKTQESPLLEGAPADPDTEDNIFVAPRDSIIVCSYKDNSPYDRYCCYINPSEDLSSDHETIV